MGQILYRNLVPSKKTASESIIADFDLALRHDQFLNPAYAYSDLVGTPKYNAPEVLDKTLNTSQFDSFILADIYSASLVLWEIVNRTTDNVMEFSPPPASLPYENILPPPTEKTNQEKVKELKPIVVDRNCRPEFTNYARKYRQLPYRPSG